jgi:hypothetical protein
VATAEATGGIERLAERDVVDALREDRLEPGLFCAVPLTAERAAGRPEGVREVHVRVRADRQAGHRGVGDLTVIGVIAPIVAHPARVCLPGPVG